MGFFSFLFGSSKSVEKLPFEGSIKFNRIKSDYKIEIGDELNIWSKPNSTIVNLYVKGSIGGNGIVGYANNKFLNNNLENTEYLFIENEAIHIDNNYINLKIKMYVDNESIENSQKKHEEEWLKKTLSKYNPKTNWSLRFYSENELDKTNLKIKIVEKETLSNYYNNAKGLIWLENVVEKNLMLRIQLMQKILLKL